ncbi:MAG: hypothetical protein JWP57_1671 [Spirosoma sp.]|nr:hypothetical protein [Spirosoma sp.]
MLISGSYFYWLANDLTQYQLAVISIFVIMLTPLNGQAEENGQANRWAIQ